MILNGKTLEAIRIAFGFSQSALARKSGVSQSRISELEAGRHKASPEVTHKLAEALGVSVGALVTAYDAETVREVAKALGLSESDVFPPAKAAS